jgi:hypothetical protein
MITALPERETGTTFLGIESDDLRKINEGVAKELEWREEEVEISQIIKRIQVTIQVAYLRIQKISPEEIARFINLSKVESLKSKINKITEEAKAFLIENELLIDMIDKIMGKSKSILGNRKHEIEIYTYKDMEVPDWEELILSYKVEEKDYHKILVLWDEIGEKVEEVIIEMKREKGEEVDKIDKIDEIFSVEVREL